MEREEKTASVAILSNGEKSYALYVGVTVIGREQGKGQSIQLDDSQIESRHAAIRIKTNTGSVIAEIVDFCTDAGTKIEGNLIPVGEWTALKTENWVTFGTTSLKFTFVPVDDDSEVISSSPEPIPLRRRCRSMVPTQSSPLNASLELNKSKSASLVLANDSQARAWMSEVPIPAVADVNHDETNEEEVIPETQQPASEKDSIGIPENEEDDSEFVFVESETQSRSDLQNSMVMSQICLVNVSYESPGARNGSHSIIVEASVDGSMNLQLDVTPSQAKTTVENDIPDIFRDTEDMSQPPEVGSRDETVTPDLDEIEQEETEETKSVKSVKSIGAVSSVATTVSKTASEDNNKEAHQNNITDDDSTLDGYLEQQDIYNAATQRVDINNLSTASHEINDSDDDIFFAATQKMPAALIEVGPKPEPISPTVASPNIYEAATQRLDLSTHFQDDAQPSTSTRDDNIYDALTQVIPREYLQISKTPVPEPIDPRPASQPDSDSSDTEFTSAPTMMLTSPAKEVQATPKTTPTDATPTQESSIFFDSFSQLNTPDIFSVKLPQPIQVKAEGEASTPKKQEESTSPTSPQASSTLVKRNTFQMPKPKPALKTNPFAHLQDSPSLKMDLTEVNTPDFLNLPSKDDLEKSAKEYESKTNGEVGDVPVPEVVEPEVSGSRTRVTKSNVNQQETPKKPARFFPKPKAPSSAPSLSMKMPPPEAVNVVSNVVNVPEPKKRALSTDADVPSTSREPSGRKRSKPTKLVDDYVTESQIGDYNIEPLKKKTSSVKKTSPLQEKQSTTKVQPSKSMHTRSVRVVIKPVAVMATALPETISPEMKPKIGTSNSRKRKATIAIQSTSDEEEEEQSESPPKLRKVKSKSNEATTNKTVTIPSRPKRGVNIVNESPSDEEKVEKAESPRKLRKVKSEVPSNEPTTSKTVKRVIRVLASSSDEEGEQEGEEEEEPESPPKLRKLKSQKSSNEPLMVKSASAPGRAKRGTKAESVDDVPEETIKTRQRDTKQRILFTMVNAGPYENKIKKTGHSLATSIEDATVLLTDKVYRSAKFLSAIARGLPIVSVSWLIAFSNKLDPDIEKYLIYDPSAENKYGFNLRGSMEDIRANGAILKDFLVVCTPSTKPHPEEVKQIVESSGGQYSDKIVDLGGRKKVGDKVLVVAHESDKKFIRDAKKKNGKVNIVTAEAFMLSVMRNELVLEKKYLL